MTKFELWTIGIGVANVILLLVGFIFAVLQLRGAKWELRTIKEIDEQQHDWSRRIAAQEALQKYDHTWYSGPLQEEFDYFNRNEPVPVQEVKSKFVKGSTVQADLIKLLNFYESLSRGIHQNIFDEEVIRIARQRAMTKAHNSFFAYIEDRRRQANPKAWSELTSIVRKWERDDNRVKPRAPANQSHGN
ncbi:DUF4760 domain-containing protein [Sulfitobacter sp. EhC04]|uniref:DUF4760 domain-containing protein n=1 Tax=Sulfitobacter sp. EhC04 TaxID=1849168 RepID=UPI0013724235|nr:DUF4760 domain-containing protein [Sulfitobacter sp. EhC04]